MITLGERIRVLREQINLTLREVASEIRIDISLLGKIERNERQPTKKQISQIATFFKVNEKLLIAELLSDEFAYRILKEDITTETLKITEAKVSYYRNKQKNENKRIESTKLL